MKLKKFFKNKKILITGHTGFKGSWLTSCLLAFGANVVGFSKNDEKLKHYKKNCFYKKVKNIYADITNYNHLEKERKNSNPQIIIHLAAQALVSDSYKNPYKTLETNVMGTLNVIEASKKLKNLKSLLIITSDKCYLNKEIKKGYKEIDQLGGDDPYSASKASAENIFNAYAKSFFCNQNQYGYATARAGNVIGGGDWSKDRLIPDCIKSIIKKNKLMIRNPNSTRPWQHVLEPISGYLLLAKLLYERKKQYSGNWNFGPSARETMEVKKVTKLLFDYLGIDKKIFKTKRNFKETILLKLNSEKAVKLLKWRNKWNMKKSIMETARWYKDYINKKDVKNTTIKQIEEYFNI